MVPSTGMTPDVPAAPGVAGLRSAATRTGTGAGADPARPAAAAWARCSWRAASVLDGTWPRELAGFDVDLNAPAKDASGGVVPLVGQAEIHASVGEPARALDILERLLRIPTSFGIAVLEVDQVCEFEMAPVLAPRMQ
jgi:hypothetical protein